MRKAVRRVKRARPPRLTPFMLNVTAQQALSGTDATAGLPFLFVLCAVGALGAVIGSFLNVVIHRVPREESIAFPASHCPSCNTAIKPYDNVPVLSWLALRGRCRACRAPISPRYPAVEALTAALFALTCWLHSGLTLSLPFDLVFVSALAARAVVPNLYGVGFIAAGYPQLPPWAVSLIGAVLGALVGGGFLWLVGWLWERVRGVEAMGLGDVKMMFIVGVALMLRRGERDMQMLLPFGIFLGLGALVSLLVGTPIAEWYAGQFK